jgi:tetratricopeptide (TPR) repeat protein
MAFDRALALRNAEKLIRQGKLADGIAEYLRIVEDAPGDWNAKNTLGDLYARAGQTDKAIEQFLEIAAHLGDEGSTAKAGAVFKKILKLKPDHEKALVEVAEILGAQRLYADARAHLNTLIELRRARGDARGALQAKVRLGSLDPDDYESRLAAASARKEMGDVGGAMSDLKEIAAGLADKGRHAEAVDVLREAEKLNADDDEIRERLLDLYSAAGDYTRARECAATVEQFRMLAASLQAQGNAEEALETLRHAARLNPLDTDLRVELARTFVARGDMQAAAEYLTVETAGDDPDLLITVADIQLRGDQMEDGVAIARRLLDRDASLRDRIATLGWTVAEKHPDAGFRVVDLAADAAVAQSDWPAAVAVLQEFVTRVPNHIAALMRLVEICVDGGLEATMFTAQAQLADAYIAAGAAAEARFLAEDLAAREPGDKSNIERFRRALELCGEPDPDALIAERLSGESPFTATDLFAGESGSQDDASEETSDAGAVDETPDVEELLAAAAAAEEERPTPEAIRKPLRRQEEEHHFELSANAIDLNAILGDFEAPPRPKAHGAAEDVEVDLSIVLEDIKPSTVVAPADGAPTASASASAPAPGSSDLVAVFGNLREQASRRSGLDDEEREYKRGLALRAAGDVEGCIASLEKAARSPKLRFSTSWLIARLYRDRGMAPQALEWLERASQASAPNKDDGLQVLYELADGLEQAGETARALAVSLELQADTADYRDIAERVDRLAKVQAQG